MLDDSFPGAYHGKAYECRATYVPVAGRYATKFRKRNEEPPTYNVWLAPIGTDASGGLRLVPVRATGRLDGMKFEAYASRVKIDGRPFKKFPPPETDAALEPHPDAGAEESRTADNPIEQAEYARAMMKPEHQFQILVLRVGESQFRSK